MRVRSTVVLVVAALAACAGVSCARSLAPGVPLATPAGVRFALRSSEARSVALAGSFNGWSESSHPLARTSADGMWVAIVALPPGEHLFMYVVDGARWISPPFAEDYVDDGFGARNGVVVVRPER